MNLKELEIKFRKSLFETHKKSGLISVSSIIYPCLRKAYYTKKYGEFYDINTAYTFYIGKAIHKMPFLKESEIELEWEGIIGRIDDYGEETLVDKKTTKTLPSRPRDHHITQMEYYYVLCLKNNKPVKDLFIHYLEKGYPAHKFFRIKPRPVEEIEKEMLERKNALEEALKTDKIPDRHLSWLCKYCNFSPKCFGKQKDAKTQNPKNNQAGNNRNIRKVQSQRDSDLRSSV